MSADGWSERGQVLRVAVAVFLVVFVLTEALQLDAFRASGLQKVRGLYALLLTVGGALLLYGVVRRAKWLETATVAFFALQVVFDPFVHFLTALGARFQLAEAVWGDPFARLSVEAAGGIGEFVAAQREALVLAGVAGGLAAGFPVAGMLFVLLRWHPFAGAPHGAEPPALVRSVAERVQSVAAQIGVGVVAAAVAIAYPVLYAAAGWLAFL